MKILKYLGRDGNVGVGIASDDEQVHPLEFGSGHIESLTDLLEADDILPMIDFLKNSTNPLPQSTLQLLPPIDEQEVWAAGVTYRRSKVARMEESEAAASCYDRVYVSDRPELFLKATPHRVVGPGAALRIRADSEWNVPEPELTLVLNSQLRLVGLTIGNDMSSRDIEGENPLYLPQAKVYDQCCSLGPCIRLLDGLPPRDQIGIALRVERNGTEVFAGRTDVGQMARTFEDLVHWLGRDNSFPHGVFLMTGTGIVPANEFSLQHGDTVEIEIDGIGILSNEVVQNRS